jgi:flagellar basal body-associated protein FliL
MADEKNEQATPGRKVPVKTAIILAAVLLIEAAAISAVFLLSGGPSAVKADPSAFDAVALAEQPVETLVIADKFQNTRTGRPYLYDTEVYAVVRQKHLGNVDMRVASMRAQITTDVATIFRRAEPSHLLEPELSTLTRQIHAALNDRLGHDEEGQPYVREVLIKRCMQFRADF